MVEKKREKIKWSPRIKPDLIQQLYQTDAQGMQDTELCDEVGMRLYFRCQTIVRVQNDEVACPLCGSVFVIQTAHKEEVTACPTTDCEWYTTRIEYQKSWSKKRIWGANAIPAFSEFYNRYPKGQTYKDKMLLIDKLIHSFHWNLKLNLPARSAANNLIEGSHDQVVAFLDQLSGIDTEGKTAWRETVETMMKRRKKR